MIIHDIRFFISESIIGIRRSGLMPFIAMATIGISLFIFGLFLLLLINLNHISDIMVSNLEIKVFLTKSLSQQDIQVFTKKLKTIKGITSHDFIDKDTAWHKFKQDYPHLKLNSTLPYNPLPHTITIQVSKKNSIEPIATILKTFTYYVEDVIYGGALAKRIELFNRFIKGVGLALVSLLGISTLMIVVNTIRLTIINRQDEITIMRLVGATNAFIKGPFLIEGLIIGTIGTLFAIILLYFGYSFLSFKIHQSIPFFPLVTDKIKIYSTLGLVGLVGIWLGIIGANISMSKALQS